MKRILIISHAYVESANLKKIEILSRSSELEIGVLTPESWRSWHGENKKISNPKSQIANVGKFQRFALPVFFSGDAGLYFYHPLKLFRLLRKFNPDIVHLEEEPWTPVALETAYFSKKLSEKLIIFSWENIDLDLSYWRRGIEGFVLHKADFALSGNEGALKRLKKHGYAGAISVLPQFGVDSDRFYPLINVDGGSSNSNRTRNHFRIGFVGRLSADKGLEILFRAFAKLDKSDTELILLSSSVQLPDYFKGLAEELKITEKIKLIAGVSHADFPDYIRSFDIQVLPSLTTPSWKEQFGRVMIEGMACGVPVIGSSSGAIPEVLGAAGLVFKEGEVNDLHDKIRQLINDAVLRGKLSQAGQDRVKKLFSNFVIAQKTHEIYQNL